MAFGGSSLIGGSPEGKHNFGICAYLIIMDASLINASKINFP
jgi:hypothetical protein